MVPEISSPYSQVTAIRKKYPLLMVSNDGNRRGARVVLPLILSDNILERLYMPPEFKPVFTLSEFGI